MNLDFVLPILLKDFYKAGHPFQYPSLTELIYSNLTPRASRMPGVTKVVSFNWQAFVKEFLIDGFTRNFFDQDRDEVIRKYKRRMETSIGGLKSYNHIGELHEVGYLPLHLKAIPEGYRVPLRSALFTIAGTDKKFGWLTNSLETLISAEMWLPITSATTAFDYRIGFEDFARLTTGQAYNPFVKWQGHDFSMRGMGSIWDSMRSGAAHLLSFTGTDTIPAIDYLEKYYFCNADRELIGGSVAATEHSVMCVDGQMGEAETIHRLLTETYPTGILSIVSDTWDFWHVVTRIITNGRIKEAIMKRDGKLVIRPDSGDPVKIMVGDLLADTAWERKGLVECLLEDFGGTTNKVGYKELDPHVGTIYGDSINRERQIGILSGLEKKKIASTNCVLGIGSFTYQHVTRDTLGLAVKATYAEVAGKGRALFKAPKTDDGTKFSAKGLLRVNEDGSMQENCTWAEESGGLLQTIFLDGDADNVTNLSAMRVRIDAEVAKEFSR